MALAAVLAGISAAGTLISTGAAFFDARAKERAAQKNFLAQLENIQAQGRRRLDQIETMTREGNAFVGSQRVAAATTGVSGSVGAAVAASQGYLIRDRERAQRQLEMDMQAAREQARINMERNVTAANNQRLSAVGSLLTSAAQFGIQGYNAGIFGGGVGGGGPAVSSGRMEHRAGRLRARRKRGYGFGP